MKRTKDNQDPPRSFSTQSNLASSAAEEVSTPRPSTSSQPESPLTSEDPSPSKSIKNFFRNRTSTYSIGSISEEPELRKARSNQQQKQQQQQQQHKKSSFISLGQDLSPIRSLNSLRPMFARSRSSVTGDEAAPAPQAGEPVEAKPTTVDDFADTSSSSDDDKYDEYEDLEEIQQIEAELDDQRLDPQQRPASLQSQSREHSSERQGEISPTLQHFIFKEEFDEPDTSMLSQNTASEKSGSSSSNTPSSPLHKQRSGSIKTIDSSSSTANILRPRPAMQRFHSGSGSQHPSIDVALANAQYVEPPVQNKRDSNSSSNDSQVIANSGNSSATSAKFRITGDKIERIRERKAKVLSITSSNLGSENRFSTSSVEEVKYPEPDLSNTNTPMQTPVRRNKPRTDSNSNSDSASSTKKDLIDLDPSKINESSPISIATPSRSGPSAAELTGSGAIAEVMSDNDELTSESGIPVNLPVTVNLPVSLPAAPEVPPSQPVPSVPSRGGTPGESSILEDIPSNLSTGNVAHRIEVRSSREIAADTQHSSLITDDVALDPSRATSMSSGELLNKLENYNRYSGLSHTSNLRFSYEDSSRSNMENLTAGLDSTTELPVMLYKVQDKDYDEGQQRWSVYERRQSDQGTLSHAQATIAQNIQGQVKSGEQSTRHQPKGSSGSSGSGSDSEGPFQLRTAVVGRSSQGEASHTFRIANPQLSAAEEFAMAPAEIRDASPFASPAPRHSPGDSPQSSTHVSVPSSTHEPSRSSPKHSPRLFPLATASRVSVPASAAVSSPHETMDHFNHMEEFRRDRPRSVRAQQSVNSLSSPAYTHMSTIQQAKISKPASNDDLDVEDPLDLNNLEKQISNSRSNNNNPRQPTSFALQGYSSVNFICMMVLGLLVPPVYFLVAFGVFDSTSGSNQQYYSGLRYYVRQQDGKILVKKYTKTQKIVSFALGLLWFSVVVAMIGVGVGLGLRHQ